MPARDIFHATVKQALVKDGWMITHDPLFLPFGGLDLYIDLGAEKIIGAEKAGQRIAVEVKSFVGPSVVSEFHTALGQFLNYRIALEEQEPERVLYLAVPLDTHTTFFTLPLVQIIVQRHQLRLIVFNPDSEEITEWKS